jgi:phosphoribosylaminoimidazole-succinocarboxamide synthase
MKPIKEILKTLSADASGALAARHAYHGLTPEQCRALAERDVRTYTGKVRDVVFDGDELLIVHSDRLTAFDKLIGMVPYKGTILTAISEFWLAEAEKVVPTHYRGRPAERVLKTRKTTPFKVEVVVRGYLAGSMMRAYQKGEREFCGERLPEGLTPYGRLPEVIITPTTKAAAFEHDENTSAKEVVERKICTQAEWDEIARLAKRLYAHGQKVFAAKGWILVDTKYEFGRAADGKILVIDEIHTPDCSRLWTAASYEARLARGEAPEMLDKETVRRWLIEHGYSGEGPVPQVPVERLVAVAELYVHVAETLIGKTLLTAGTPDPTVDIAALVAAR